MWVMLALALPMIDVRVAQPVEHVPLIDAMSSARSA